MRYVYEYHKLTKALVVQDHRREIMADFSFFLQYSDDDIIQMNIQNWWPLWEIGGISASHSIYVILLVCQSTKLTDCNFSTVHKIRLLLTTNDSNKLRLRLGVWLKQSKCI